MHPHDLQLLYSSASAYPHVLGKTFRAKRRCENTFLLDCANTAQCLKEFRGQNNQVPLCEVSIASTCMITIDLNLDEYFCSIAPATHLRGFQLVGSFQKLSMGRDALLESVFDRHKPCGCGQKPWYGSFRAAVRVIQTLWIRALIQALWIKPTSHLIQAPDMNTSAWWHFTPPLSHQFTVKVVASQIKAILFVASLF